MQLLHRFASWKSFHNFTTDEISRFGLSVSTLSFFWDVFCFTYYDKAGWHHHQLITSSPWKTVVVTFFFYFWIKTGKQSSQTGFTHPPPCSCNDLFPLFTFYVHRLLLKHLINFFTHFQSYRQTFTTSEYPHTYLLFESFLFRKQISYLFALFWISHVLLIFHNSDHLSSLKN